MYTTENPLVHLSQKCFKKYSFTCNRASVNVLGFRVFVVVLSISQILVIFYVILSNVTISFRVFKSQMAYYGCSSIKTVWKLDKISNIYGLGGEKVKKPKAASKFHLDGQLRIYNAVLENLFFVSIVDQTFCGWRVARSNLLLSQTFVPWAWFTDIHIPVTETSRLLWFLPSDFSSERQGHWHHHWVISRFVWSWI